MIDFDKAMVDRLLEDYDFRLALYVIRMVGFPNFATSRTEGLEVTARRLLTDLCADPELMSIESWCFRATKVLDLGEIRELKLDLLPLPVSVYSDEGEMWTE